MALTLFSKIFSTYTISINNAKCPTNKAPQTLTQFSKTATPNTFLFSKQTKAFTHTFSSATLSFSSITNTFSITLYNSLTHAFLHASKVCHLHCFKTRFLLIPLRQARQNSLTKAALDPIAGFTTNS